ncbi:MAG: GNAT family N-acetyltransferase [Candidatus Omnitrophica bacterium]|nr:GNAT family N-acetyltransferase [Candidatus Omnitrophota bacterium]
MGTDGIDIRVFYEADREAVRRISRETAFLGEPYERFFSDGEILADALTLYYTDYEPGSCFVATEADRVVGYLTGARDVTAMRCIVRKKIAPALLVKALQKKALFHRGKIRFLGHILVSFLKGEFFAPDFSKKYPATLHINLEKGYRGRKIGKRLIECYIAFLRGEGVRGVHFGTMSERAKGFFLKLGFSVLSSTRRSYLRYQLKRPLPYYILGKVL